MHWETINVYTVLVGRAYGKRLHERLLYKWNNNITMEHNDIDFKNILSFHGN